MSSIEDDPQSPELGDRPNPSQPPKISESSALEKVAEQGMSDEEEEEQVTKKKRTLKRDTREWTEVLSLQTGDESGFDDEEVNHQMYQEAKKIMEQSGLCKLSTHKPKDSDLHLWKKKIGWSTDGDASWTNIFTCPLLTRFGCQCQLRLTNTPTSCILEMRGTHDATSHAPEKDKSKFLKLQQIEAIRTGVRLAPKQSAKHLRRNLMFSSPPKRIGPDLARSVERRVRRLRAELTSEKLEMDGAVMDDSYSALEKFVESKWFETLLEQHNDPDCDYHINLFEPIVIGKDLNPSDDIVYFVLSSLWFLFNIYRNIECGWLFQLNGDVTYCINRAGVASLSLGVNSLGHVNNPICWAIIPEKTEGRKTYAETWYCVEEAAIKALCDYKCCDDADCETCFMVTDLRMSPRVQQKMKTKAFKSGQLEVEATLCDHLRDFHNFSKEVFNLEANTCDNHFLGIQAANYSQRKYFLSQQNYDKFYDVMVRIQKISMEIVCNKAHDLVESFMVDELNDTRAWDWWSRNWSMESGFGRWSICHGGYSGYVTNASHERGHREDKEPCNEKSSLGEFLGNRCHTIKAQGEEIRSKMQKQGTPNRFITIPPITKDVWDHVQSFHCKTLALSLRQVVSVTAAGARAAWPSRSRKGSRCRWC
jgi:hypothetical protein